jgi:hypothetical protein
LYPLLQNTLSAFSSFSSGVKDRLRPISLAKVGILNRCVQNTYLS